MALKLVMKDIKLKKIGTFVCFFFASVIVYSQSITKEAEKAYWDSDYKKAVELYEAIVKKYPTSALYNHRYGVCLYETDQNLEKAEIHLKYAIKKGIKLSNFYLGKVYLKTFRFDEALDYILKYKETIKKRDERMPEVIADQAAAEEGKRLISGIEDISILGYKLVSDSTFWKYYTLSKEAGTILLPEQLPVGMCDSASVGYMTERQDRFYFSCKSTRGTDLDIYSSNKWLKEWSVPKELNNDVNSEYNEEFPFLLSDGRTLYFSSDRPGGIGGYDIYVTRLNPNTNTFLPPKNLGLPYNSPDNDYLFVTDDFQNTGFFATDRNCLKGEVALFCFTPNEYRKLVKNDNYTPSQLAVKARLYPRDSILKDGENRFPIKRKTEQKKVVSKQMDISSEKQINFVLNDSIVYFSMTQFVSDKAAGLFLLYQDTEKLLNEIKINLEGERRSLAQNPDDISPEVKDKIIDLEIKLYQAEAKKESSLKEARIEETKAIRLYGVKILDPEKTAKVEEKNDTLDVVASNNDAFNAAADKDSALILEFSTVDMENLYTKIFNPDEIKIFARYSTREILVNRKDLALMSITDSLLNNKKTDNEKVAKWFMFYGFDAPEFSKNKSFTDYIENIRIKNQVEVFKNKKGKFDLMMPLVSSVLRSAIAENDKAETRKFFDAAEVYYEDANTAFSSLQLDEGNKLENVERANSFMKKAISYVEKSLVLSYFLAERNGIWKQNNQNSKVAESTIPIEEERVDTASVKFLNKIAEPDVEAFVYRIQIGVFRNSLSKDILLKVEPVKVEDVGSGGLKRYYSGNYSTYEEAKNDLEKIKKLGFQGAFVVTFKNDKRIK